MSQRGNRTTISRFQGDGHENRNPPDQGESVLMFLKSTLAVAQASAEASLHPAPFVSSFAGELGDPEYLVWPVRVT